MTRTVVEKRDASISATKSDQLSLRCGDCLHFTGNPHPAYGQPCKAIGIRPFATAPSCYAPNVMLFRKSGPSTFASLASLISTFSPQQSRVLMGLLKAAGSLEKYGYTFLEKVYFRVGDDYLDNYFYGHVLGLGVNGTLAIVGATYFANVKSPMTAYLFPDSVYGHAAFVKKRSRLEKHGLLYAPRRPKKNDISDGYEPPTMETSPELLEKLALVTFGKKKADPRKMHESVTTLEINLFGKGKPTPVPVTVEGVPKKRGRKRSEDDALDDEEDDDL